MKTADKVNLAAVAIVAAAFGAWSLFSEYAQEKAEQAEAEQAAYLACMDDKLGALKIEDLDPRVKKTFVRACSVNV